MMHAFTDERYLFLEACWLLPLASLFFLIALIWPRLRTNAFWWVGVIYSIGCGLDWFADWIDKGFNALSRAREVDPAEVWPCIAALGWVVLVAEYLIAWYLRPWRLPKPRALPRGFEVVPLRNPERGTDPPGNPNASGD
jgi:hypothetical protein